MYGNYDGKGLLPKFDLYLGANIWDSVEFQNASGVITKEMVHVASSDYIHVCLVNTNMGVPFISALEIRVLQYNCYEIPSQNVSLELLERYDVRLENDQMLR